MANACSARAKSLTLRARRRFDAELTHPFAAFHALGFELTVIASAVVGGVAIRGGSGTLLGIILGSLTLLVIKNGLTLVRVDPLWLQGVYGLVILVAIGIDNFIVRRSQQARAR